MTPPEFCIKALTWTVLDPRSGVPSEQGVWIRDDYADVEILDQRTFRVVEQGCRLAGEHMAVRRPREAHTCLVTVLERLPGPIGRWNAAGWALLALGHAHFSAKNWDMARAVLTDAMWSPGVFGNPWAHRLKGQAHLELGERDRAADDLARAYLGAGRSIFGETETACMALVAEILEPPPGAHTLR